MYVLSYRNIGSFVHTNYSQIVISGPAIAYLVAAIATFVSKFSAVRPQLNGDAAFWAIVGRGWFQYGIVPYRDVWDVKPPLTHETAALIAAVTPSPAYAYIASVLFTILTGLFIVQLAAAITHQYTNSLTSSVAAGLFFLTFATFVHIPISGLRIKYLVLLFGLLSVYLFNRDMPRAAAASATLAAGYWQMGLIFPLVIGGAVYRDHSKKIFLQCTAIAGGITVLAVAPFVVADASAPMFAQVILSPFLSPESQTLVDRYSDLEAVLGFRSLLLVAAMYGSIGYLIKHKTAFIPLCLIGWFLVSILLFDFDGSPDLIPLLGVTSIGIGLLFALDDSLQFRALAGVLLISAVLIMISPAAESAWYGGFNGRLHSYFWDGKIATQCHFRRSPMEIEWIQRTPALSSDWKCWPADWEALIQYFRQ